MDARDRPAAWIVSKPRFRAMWQARSLFAAVGRDGIVQARRGTGAAASRAPAIVPHLTLEILYAPLPDVSRLRKALADVARRHCPLGVPATGTYTVGTSGVAIELALTPELLALRREVAAAMHRSGARPHPAAGGGWRPHLTVIGPGRLDGSAPVAAGANANRVVEGYRFPVDSLTLSLPVGKGYREIGPYRLRSASTEQKRGGSQRMFRFLLGLTFGVVLGAFGMAYLWWKDEQERAGATFSPPSPQQ